MAGGDNNTITLSIEEYNLATDTWEMVTELDEHRFGCRVAALGSKILVFGSVVEPHGSNWKAFDTESGQWASESSSNKHSTIPQGLTFCAAATRFFRRASTNSSDSHRHFFINVTVTVTVGDSAATNRPTSCILCSVYL